MSVVRRLGVGTIAEKLMGGQWIDLDQPEPCVPCGLSLLGVLLQYRRDVPGSPHGEGGRVLMGRPRYCEHLQTAGHGQHRRRTAR
jgi:hypothetical protein